jgi:DeoR/GlpR family transcriptional regulator of sugar metabolism/ABC-type sugar transport system substrate-binding protein
MMLNPRQAAILRMVHKYGSLSVGRLTETFDVGRETLRKDLVSLESLGYIDRKYGRIDFLDGEASRQWLSAESRLSASQRRDRILELIKGRKSVRISSLAARLKVSGITVRSDLQNLEQAGFVVRKHGSVSPLPGAAGGFEAETSDSFPPKVRILGEHALLRISPGDTIYLGAGEIARYIATFLPPDANITVVSDDLDILSLLRRRGYASPICVLPGRLRSDSPTIVVENAQSVFSRLSIGKAFLMISSYADGTYYMESPEVVANAVEASRNAAALYFVLESVMLDKRGKNPFPYREFRDKVQEILIDDSVDQSVVNYLFPRRDPVVIQGADFSFKRGRRQQFRIGFLVDRDRGFFIQEVYNSLLDSVLERDNVSLDIRETERGFYSTVRNADVLLSQHPDLVINFTLCAESLSYIGDKCKARGVKLMTIDLQDRESVYFGADNALAGALAASHTIRFIQENWRGRLDHIVAFARHGIDPVTNLRVMSVVERIQEEICCSSPEPEVIEWDTPNEAPKEALLKFLLSVPKGDKVLFITFNLPHILGSYELITQHMDPKNTLIVGQNFNEQVEELMRRPNSPILGCVHYNPEKYGSRVLDIALRMLNGESVESVNYTTHTWISRESVLA